MSDAMKLEVAESEAWATGDLNGRPGFLIRRLHQIHLALFYEACRGFNITPVQSSILTVLAEHGAMDQARLAVMIGVDRATVGQVVKRLAARAFVDRTESVEDKRLKLVKLTEKGSALLASIAPLTAAAHRRTLAALSPRERRHFLISLKKLVEANNALGRAPLQWGRGMTA